MTSRKYDWLGLCLDMMAEYFPVDIITRSDAEKYWNINEHLMCIMEHSELSRHSTGDKQIDARNDLVKDMIRLFTASNMNSEGDESTDNVAINNLLLLSLID